MLLLSGIMKKGTSKILKKDKGLRIDNQYCLKNKPVNFEKLSDFILSIKKSLDKLDDKKIVEIREKIENF